MNAEAKERIIPNKLEIKRFLAKTKISENGECLLWTGYKIHNGYGRVRFGKRLWLAHRFAFLIHHGPIPDGMYVLHSCDTPSCTSIHHLSLGTQQDNMDQRMARGRHKPMFGDENPTRQHPERMPRGINNHKSKLNDLKVMQIRHRSKVNGETASSISKDYGISIASTCYAISGHTWAHIPMPPYAFNPTLPPA